MVALKDTIIKILKLIGVFFVKVFVAIGLFLKNLVLGIGRGTVKLFKGIAKWFKNFGKRFKDSSTPTKIGHFAMGVGNIAHKQYTRGIIYLLIEILFFVFMIASPKASGANLGFKAIGNFFSLGSPHAMDVDAGIKTFDSDFTEVVGQIDEEAMQARAVRTLNVLLKVEGNYEKYVTSADDKYSTQLMVVDKDYSSSKKYLADTPDYYSYAEYPSGFGDKEVSISIPFSAWVESTSEINFDVNGKDFKIIRKSGGEDQELPLAETGGRLIVYKQNGTSGINRYFVLITGVTGRGLRLELSDTAPAALKTAHTYLIGYNSDYVNAEVDNSFLMMLFGVFTVAIIVIFIMVYLNSIKSQYGADLEAREGKQPQNFKQDLKDLLGDKFHLTLLLPAIIFLVIFTIIPTIFMILISFTDFQTSAQMSGSKLINWVGLDNFISLFSSDASNTMAKEVGMNFGSILLWTFIWAIIATFSCYFGGILLALLLNKKEIKAKKFWRTIFILTIAIPQFISLLVMRLLLKNNGPLNGLFGISTDWLAQSSEYADVSTITAGVIWRVRITILVVNLWLGIPYTMLMTSGILMNIPADLYEAATIDGANKFQMFRKITLPYVIFVTTPYLISSFIGNITAFNTIYLLTGGGPTKGNGIVAGETDLLVTWLYKLTITNVPPLYNAGSVIGILTFIITSLLTLIFYRNSKAYKEEDTFQ